MDVNVNPIENGQGSSDSVTKSSFKAGFGPYHPGNVSSFNKRVFSSKQIRDSCMPIWNELYTAKESEFFREPVDPVAMRCPDYPTIIKEPMDLSTIAKKLQDGAYWDHWGFVDDFYLMCENAWLYNAKTSQAHNDATVLSEIFDARMDKLMKDLSYCCGRRYVYTPKRIICTGGCGGHITRGANYYFYETGEDINPDPEKTEMDPDVDKYECSICAPCFQHHKRAKGDLLTPLAENPGFTRKIRKDQFVQRKNDIFEFELFVECVHCGIKHHEICALHNDEIYSKRYVCPKCSEVKRISGRKQIRATQLPKSKLGDFIEAEVNKMVSRQPEPAQPVVIRVVSSTDKITDVKPGMKKRFESNGIDPVFPYRTKTIFAFQEIEGTDVCFFGMRVQECGSECPGPNNRRVNIAYLDSVHFFQPRRLRTEVYYSILMAYLEYCRNIGFTVAHIWASPPPTDHDDYIFYCHPSDQKVPKPTRLQEWYKQLLDKAVRLGKICDYRNMLEYTTEENLSLATELPYFEGDYWPNELEEAIKLLDKQKPKYGGPPKRRRISTSTRSRSRRKATKKEVEVQTNDSLMMKAIACMEKHRDMFYVVTLHSPETAAKLGPINDPDPIHVCELMESRDKFLTFAEKRNYEFSTLRRAKFSTIVFLHELFKENKAFEVENACFCSYCKTDLSNRTRLHCKVCPNFNCCNIVEDPHEHELIRVTRQGVEVLEKPELPVVPWRILSSFLQHAKSYNGRKCNRCCIPCHCWITYTGHYYSCKYQKYCLYSKLWVLSNFANHYQRCCRYPSPHCDEKCTLIQRRLGIELEIERRMNAKLESKKPQGAAPSLNTGRDQSHSATQFEIRDRVYDLKGRQYYYGKLAVIGPCLLQISVTPQLQQEGSPNYNQHRPQAAGSHADYQQPRTPLLQRDIKFPFLHPQHESQSQPYNHSSHHDHDYAQKHQMSQVYEMQPPVTANHSQQQQLHLNMQMTLMPFPQDGQKIPQFREQSQPYCGNRCHVTTAPQNLTLAYQNSDVRQCQPSFAWNGMCPPELVVPRTPVRELQMEQQLEQQARSDCMYTQRLPQRKRTHGPLSQQQFNAVMGNNIGSHSCNHCRSQSHGTNPVQQQLQLGNGIQSSQLTTNAPLQFACVAQNRLPMETDVQHEHMQMERNSQQQVVRSNDYQQQCQRTPSDSQPLWNMQHGCPGSFNTPSCPSGQFYGRSEYAESSSSYQHPQQGHQQNGQCFQRVVPHQRPIQNQNRQIAQMPSLTQQPRTLEEDIRRTYWINRQIQRKAYQSDQRLRQEWLEEKVRLEEQAKPVAQDQIRTPNLEQNQGYGYQPLPNNQTSGSGTTTTSSGNWSSSLYHEDYAPALGSLENGGFQPYENFSNSFSQPMGNENSTVENGNDNMIHILDQFNTSSFQISNLNPFPFIHSQQEQELPLTYPMIPLTNPTTPQFVKITTGIDSGNEISEECIYTSL